MIAHKLLYRDSIDEIKLLERTLFCFGEEEKNECCGNEIEAGKERDRACVPEFSINSVELKLVAVPIHKVRNIKRQIRTDLR